MSDLEAAKARVRELEEARKAEKTRLVELRAEYQTDFMALKQRHAEEIDALQNSFQRRGLRPRNRASSPAPPAA